jgi:alkanesulfonate monooxygenase SsuD/methylene tetrahydromethanopterin reductase-like flavin-dependent oxidoreductase (luciferase family)
MKFLYYSAIPWPHLHERMAAFPHDNSVFDAQQGADLYAESLRLFRAAEDAGFDWLGVGEEHMNAYGVVPNPCLIAASIAARTRHAKIAVLGNPLPILNPLRVAEEYAMLDLISGGRLVAGFPRGVPQNYAAYGFDPANSMAKLTEAVSLVLKAWEAKGPFDWRDEHYTYTNVSIWPQPMGRPDLVFSGRSNESIALAVRHKAIIGELYVKNALVMDHFAQSVEEYGNLARAAGWEAGPDRFLLSVPCVIAAHESDARAVAGEALEYQTEKLTGTFEAQKAAVQDTYYGPTSAGLQRRSVDDLDTKISYGGIICGSPASAVDQIKCLAARTGVGTVGLQMQFGNLSEAVVRRSLRLFGDVVRPGVSM